MDFIKNGAKIPTTKPISVDKMSFLHENNQEKDKLKVNSVFSQLKKGMGDFIGKGLFREKDKDDYNKQPIEWMEKIIKTKDIDIMGESKHDLISVLLDLALYETPSLVDIAYKAVNCLYS